MNTAKELAVIEHRAVDVVAEAMTPEVVIHQVALIQEVMAKVMRDGEHYGIVPGAKKPSLLKPGAEKLSLTFRLSPSYAITRNDLPNGHREYIITATLVHINSGAVVGEGVGSCSTMESKYRWRKQVIETEAGTVPKAYWDTPKEDAKARAAVLVATFGPGKYRTKKTEGAWKVFRIEGDEDARIENPDIADVYNTVLKMAKKRAHVDAVLTATAASDIFTQDVEDFAEATPPQTHEEAPGSKSAPAEGKATGQSAKSQRAPTSEADSALETARRSVKTAAKVEEFSWGEDVAPFVLATFKKGFMELTIEELRALRDAIKARKVSVPPSREPGEDGGYGFDPNEGT